MKETKSKNLHHENVLCYLSSGDDTEVEEFSMMRQLIYSMEMAEAGRREGCSHPLASPLALSRKRGLWHSLTQSLFPSPRQRDNILDYASTRAARLQGDWKEVQMVSILVMARVRISLCWQMWINKPLSRRDETHCRMEGCSPPVKLKAEVNGQSKRGERYYGHQRRLFVRGLREVFTWCSENCQTWQTSTKTETFMTTMQQCMMRQEIWAL